MIYHSADKVYYRLLLFRKLDCNVRSRRRDGEAFVRDHRSQPQGSRSGVNENRPSGFDKLRCTFGNAGLFLRRLIETLSEIVLGGGREKLHRPCAAPDLDKLALCFKAVYIAAERHACDFRKHFFKLAKRYKRSCGKQIANDFKPLFLGHIRPPFTV